MAQPVPSTPTVISPSPTPSQASGKDGYFAPVTRSKGSSSRATLSQDDHPDLTRARTRSRQEFSAGTMNGTITSAKDSMPSAAATGSRRSTKQVYGIKPEKDDVGGLLTPAAAYKQAGLGRSYWRNLSRSPSPLGLIPIHQDFRAFVHKHEIPRKVLHVSIGFITLYLYHVGVQTSSIHPVLLSLLVPIFIVDLVRFRYPAFNDVYIKVMGAFMRESEAHDRFNGVISYLAGLWATMYFCRKDIAVMSVLLLSWCDTAASTFGRAFGKYTPKVRRGKSLAGSIACLAFGIAAASLFWGVIAPRSNPALNQGENSFAFNDKLTLPTRVREWLGMTRAQASVSGGPALTIMSLVAGLIASVSEAIDLWGLDDNLTIPILCGAGLEVFLRLFGNA
ncbi:hypothetical protein AMS68_003163 [Peltaster fructicola]|uniref:Phosphatidate cytidylyltransferase n=1 Tax=Peltaster fructicola TaxID=286661 RepID=A0A6H0XSJ2_9PEZI|nr:hypothetical protein AMS68_003163 [Peltaster fructicola]